MEVIDCLDSVDFTTLFGTVEDFLVEIYCFESDFVAHHLNVDQDSNSPTKKLID